MSTPVERMNIALHGVTLLRRARRAWFAARLEYRHACRAATSPAIHRVAWVGRWRTLLDEERARYASAVHQAECQVLDSSPTVAARWRRLYGA